MSKKTLKLNLNNYYPKVPSSATKAQIAAGKKRAKEVKQHFKKDGWDLCYNGVMELIVYDILGFHAEQLFWPHMKGINLDLKFSDKQGQFIISKGKK